MTGRRRRRTLVMPVPELADPVAAWRTLKPVMALLTTDCPAEAHELWSEIVADLTYRYPWPVWQHAVAGIPAPSEDPVPFMADLYKRITLFNLLLPVAIAHAAGASVSIPTSAIGAHDAERAFVVHYLATLRPLHPMLPTQLTDITFGHVLDATTTVPVVHADGALWSVWLPSALRAAMSVITVLKAGRGLGYDVPN